MTQPAPAPTPTPAPPAPTPTPAPVPAPPAAAPQPVPAAPPAPTYVPPPSLAPPAPAAPPGPVYVPPVPVPSAPPADPDDGSRDVTKLPQWAQNDFAKLRDENAKRRISERTAVVNQHAHYAAGQLGANPAALLGSVAFAQAAGELDPHAADFPAKLTAAIQQTITANPWMAAAAAATPTPTPPPPPTSGAEFPGGSGAGVPITEDQLAQMTPEQIAQAMSDGKLKHLL